MKSLKGLLGVTLNAILNAVWDI